MDQIVLRVLLDAPPPHTAHARLSARHPTTFLLESREGPERLARYSFLGFAPAGTITHTRTGLDVTGALPAPSRDQAALEYLRRIQAFYAVDDHESPFVGGLVGSIGYDFVRTLEPVLERDAAETWPRFVFGLYLDALVYDHQAGTCHYVSRGEDRSALVHEALVDGEAPDALTVGRFGEDRARQGFEADVRRAQELIRAGEAFQIVLSRAVHAPYEGSLLPLYAWLREEAAVPYLFHLRFGGADPMELMGASPEGLVRVRGDTVETFPIAGTRPLTGDEAADEAAGRHLAQDRKETAEHAMLVDLARNDIGRVAQPGTVEVAAYQELHRFRSVQHLVSHVQGRLRPDRDALDALSAVFPAGTVSGAPKVRAMEHIDALEHAPRGPYAGAVAYHSFNGDLDSAITIRSLSARGGRLTVQAGAGIVHRSDPGAEFDETRHKADTLLRGLARFTDETPGMQEAPPGRPETPPGPGEAATGPEGDAPGAGAARRKA